MANHPIFAPTFRGDVAKVKRILDADPSLVSVRDAKGLTPLHVAASRGQVAVIQLLIDYGADVEGANDDDKWTPLVFASYRGHLGAVKVLIENGAGVTVAAGNPIHFAGQRKHKDICKLLVEHGAVDGLSKSSDADVVKLFRAAYSYDSVAVKELLARRPELVNFTDQNGRSPLHEVCTHGDTKTARVLLGAGADVSIKDSDGQTPIDRAADHRQQAVKKLLEQHILQLGQ
ncbi:ankyrin repeat domain-containing protein [bacterium]|nr:ankyrin repeat domain-containing protein [bacterium]